MLLMRDVLGLPVVFIVSRRVVLLVIVEGVQRLELLRVLLGVWSLLLFSLLELGHEVLPLFLDVALVAVLEI